MNFSFRFDSRVYKLDSANQINRDLNPENIEAEDSGHHGILQ